MNGNGSAEIELTGDDQADLKGLKDRFDNIAEGQGAAIKLSRAELGLLHKMITAPEEWRKEQVFLMADFLDEDEALDHVAAYYEALDLGMDTGFNVAFIFALAACSRKMVKNNRVALLLDSMQHVKYTANVPKDYQGGGPVKHNSPLS